MKQLIIAILFFLPISVSAQLLNSYGVVEIGASFPLSSTRGAKFAYRVTDSSYYRWIHTNTWVKILEPSIDPDTLYLKQLSGTTALVDGDTIDISTYFLKSDTTSAFASYLKRPVGWGLSLLTGKYPFVDSSKVASRYYVSTAPTSIANNYIATSNGSNLVARNLFDNNTYVGILNSKPFQLGQWTTAGRPSGTAGYEGYNTTGNGKEWYQGSRWAYALEATFARGTATYVPFFDVNGQVTQDADITWNSSLNNLIINSSGANGALTVNPSTAADGVLFTSNRAAWVSRRRTDEADFAALAVVAISGDFTSRLGIGLYTGAPYVGFGSGAAVRDVFIQRPVSTQALTFNFTSSNTERFRFTNTAAGFFTSSPTQELDVNGDAYIRDSTRLTTTPAHSAITGLLTRDANGWVGLTTVGTGLNYSGGVLSTTGTADGNGIYTGSGTLASHTTRALIPSTGNLLFSQTYNSTDSAYIQVVNNLDGNREVRGGLTDTASTGFSKFRFYQDEPNEEMGWEVLTDDGTGTTAVGAQGGNLSLYADAAGTVEVRGQELRLNNGEVSMNQYGQGNMKASDLSATDSKFVAKFSDGGKVLDYYLARDTFIEDVTLFSVGTLMNDCQELTIVSSMTATAPSHQEIRFPDAGDHLRGKKIIVYQKKKEAGIYVPQIKVVGGVSRLYFTTNTLTTDPSDQSVLSMDDVTWYTHGVTYEFTCLRIDNTPSYRWVLKQR